MKSDNQEGINVNFNRDEFNKKDSLLPTLLLSLCLTFVALVMLLWVPSPISYKNVNSLSELNPEKVQYYTENQHVYLVFQSNNNPDTIRSLSDYTLAIQKETLREQEKLLADQTPSEELKKSNQYIKAKSGKGKSHTQTLSEIVRDNTLEITTNGGLRGGEEVEDNLVIEPDQRPTFPKGLRGLELYLTRNKRKPIYAKTNQVKGEVELRFIVNVDGTLSDIRILKGLGYGCDEEALRLVENMPSWQPAFKNNQAVRCYENISIKF